MEHTTGALVPVAVTEDGHVLADCYMTCLGSEPGHAHHASLDLDDALDVAFTTPNPRVSEISVDITRNCEVLVTTILGPGVPR